MPRITEAQLAELERLLGEYMRVYRCPAGDDALESAHTAYSSEACYMAPELVAEVRRLRGVIERASSAYGDALREGVDASGAWDCVAEILAEADDAGN